MTVDANDPRSTTPAEDAHELTPVRHVVYALASDAERLNAQWNEPETLADALYEAERLRAVVLTRMGRRVRPAQWAVDAEHLRMAQMLITMNIDDLGDDQRADRLPVVNVGLASGVGVALWRQVDAAWMHYVAATRSVEDLDEVPSPDLGFLPDDVRDEFVEAFGRQLAKRSS